MTFRKLAFKNVKGNWQQYSAFFLSSVFSVMILYIFSAFIYHPDVVNGNISAADRVLEYLTACQYIILVFSFFFVLYSISAYLKSRKMEFGLFLLFGMTNSQIKRMVVYESVLISFLAIGAGIGLGALFSKLFFMAMAELLNMANPIRFMVPAAAIGFTAGWFFLLFMLITALTLWKVGHSEIIELLHAARKPKTQPISSPWLVLVAIVSLTGCYYLTYTTSSLDKNGLPILALMVIGTYFLFTQASVTILRRLQHLKSLYYKRTNLVTLSAMTFKMKDNSRVLFMVSILSVVILTASTLFYVFYQNGKDQMEASRQPTIAYEEKGLHAHHVFDPERLRQLIREEGLDTEYEMRYVGLPVTFMLQPNSPFVFKGAIISESEFNTQTALLKDVPPIQVNKDHAVLVYPFQIDQSFSALGQMIELALGDGKTALQIDEIRGFISLGPSDYSFIVDDEQFDYLAKQIDDADKSVYYSYMLKNWRSIDASFGEKLSQVAGTGEVYTYVVDDYRNIKQVSSLIMFVSLFVSVLFFIASGSMLYFKLFTELGEDRRQFAALARLGMSHSEVSQTVTSQIGILFIVPCVIGIIHTIFAMKALGNAMKTNVFGYVMIVAAIYFVMQFFYFLFARRSYMKKLFQNA